MPLRSYSLASPPTRASAWKLLTEASGYFTGAIDLADLATSPRIKESQIRFFPDGHDHDGTDGAALTASSIRKGNFDLQSLCVAWGNFWQSQWTSSTSISYHIVTGTGTCATAFTEQPASSGYYYKTAQIDWDFCNSTPSITDSALDLRTLTSGIDTAVYTSSYTRELVGLFFSVRNPSATAALDKVLNFTWYTSGGAHYAKLTTADSAASVTFDYVAIVKLTAP